MTMILQQWLLFLVGEYIFLCISGQAVVQGRRCKFHAKPQNSRFEKAGNVTGSEQLCTRTQCCVGYHLLVNGQPVVDLLACDMAEKSCPNATCEASTSFDERLIKCVCNTDLCNHNITWKPNLKQPQLTSSYDDQEVSDQLLIVYLTIPIGILLVLCLMLVTVKRRCLCKENVSVHDDSVTPLCSCHTTETSETDSANIELQQIMGSGQFATVWQGKYQGSVVAVKVFPAGYKHQFTLEKEVYELPLMKHAGIVHFLGAGRKVDGGEWLIVLELAACGSLHSFLSKQTSSWMSSLKLCQSLAQGLAYLHSDLHTCGVHKPAVAHRDLSSSNVLVRVDGTCTLSDFGCSSILRSCPGRHRWQCHIGNMEAQVGTLRYMSPEILEGSVNLSSGWCLMQGDVYALGLLLWEIWMRCSDLFEGSLVPEHHLPYEAELGDNLTLESLILYASQMDKRPSIPEHWEQAPQFQGSALQELVMDCWDHDPDARLTAPCVVDRLLSLHPSCSV